MKICKYCKKEIDGNNKVFACHVRWCDKNETNGDKGRENISKSKIDKYCVLYGNIKDYNVTCNKCGLELIIKERELKFPTKNKYFCNRSCANSRDKSNVSIETRLKISNSVKSLWKDGFYDDLLCDSIKFSSIGEKEIRDFFKNTYKDDNWTFGGLCKYKEQLITSDLYSRKLKVCIEYDGIWHFKDMHNQLEDKQYKDYLIQEWCELNGWRLIRIKEDVYKKDKEFWIDQISNEVYNGINNLIKFY